MLLTLKGRIITPIITKKTVFVLEGCRAVILNPRRRYIAKSHKERRIYPYSFIAYLGNIELTYKNCSFEEMKKKLLQLLTIESVGRQWSEGMGRIEWFSGHIKRKKRLSKGKKYKHVRIRKGLPHNLSEEFQKLLRYAMLHDFSHSSRHRSKIYVEPELRDIDYLRKHHEHSEDPVIQTFQKYDRIAASMTRKIRSPRNNRYNWQSKRKINFEILAKEIQEVSDHIWKLYEYIYKSKELADLNESLQYGHTSLRYHILLLVNLIVQNYLGRNS